MIIHTKFEICMSVPLSMYVTKGKEGDHPKCLQMRTGGEGYHASCVRQHLSLFMFLSYDVLWQQVTVSIRLFFTWVLCIYIILDKGCHILYAFGLNSKVCSHIVGVHLSSDQVIFYFVMDAALYNSFLLRLGMKSF